MPWSMYDREGQRKYLTRSEADEFIAAAHRETVPVYSFCWFMAATGCRISEALSITIRNIDFTSEHVIIKCLKKRQKRVYRAIPLPAKLLRRLKEWIAAGIIGAKDRLWPWSRMTGYRRITEVMQKANIKGSWATPKGLRHGFGVRAIQSGVPLNLVQRWLGHADMKTTAIYTSAIGPEEREIAARTWLEQDANYERNMATLQTPHPPISDTPASEDSEKKDRPPVRVQGFRYSLKHLLSVVKTTGSCHLIQFWLQCNRIFR